MPVQLEGGKSLAVIGGRSFLRIADYRALAERIRTGDLSELLSTGLFQNVIFAARHDLEDLAGRVADSARRFTRPPHGARKSQHVEMSPGKSLKTKNAKGSDAEAEVVEDKAHAAAANGNGIGITHTAKVEMSEKDTTVEKSAVERSRTLQGSGSLEEACRRAVRTLVEDYDIASLALMLRADDSFYPTCVTGIFEKKPPRVALKVKEIKLLLAATQGDSIAVPAGGRTSSKHEDAVELFPLVVGEEIKGALLVGDKDLSEEQRLALASYCREISMPLEVVRLREELERRVRAATQLRAFTEVVNSAKPEDAYTTILRHSAELLHAERGSLLLFDEGAGELSVKASLGPRADISRDERIRIGEGVSGTVMREGRPAVVRDVSTVQGIHPAPAERSYKTNSFISYPIVIAGRKVGVLNVTDKAGGGAYDELDLGLLDMIAPQMALALDRVEWHRKATQFQLLSITDPLTSLVNRRYLEERLSEELDRSKRHHLAMSFMMLDIDDFKNYNDTHGHQAGDLALEMTAQCLKTALRSADVAARYGGEEFSILLPQSGLTEARVIAERIRRRIERTQFPHGKAQPTGAVTVSIGISSFSPELDAPASIIYAADQALYLAKSRGKNCVEAYVPKAATGKGPEGQTDS